MAGVRLFGLAPSVIFAKALLPGVCCARIYARRLVLCVIQTASCLMIACRDLAVSHRLLSTHFTAFKIAKLIQTILKPAGNSKIIQTLTF